MRKIFLTITLMVMAALSLNAQTLFTMKMTTDRFDDFILEPTDFKTLVSVTDSTFIVEEKGRTPVQYYILNRIEDSSVGSENNIVEVGNGKYGYQIVWCVIRMTDLNKVKFLLKQAYSDPYGGELYLNQLEDYLLFVTYRVISVSRYYFETDSVYFWIEDEKVSGKLGHGVNRVIYKR